MTAIEQSEGVAIALCRAAHQIGIGGIPGSRTLRSSHLPRDCSGAGKSSTDHALWTRFARRWTWNYARAVTGALISTRGTRVDESASTARTIRINSQTITNTEACTPIAAAVGMNVSANNQ